MAKMRISDMEESMGARFILPVMGENVLTIFIGMAFSSLISSISSSALAAIGISNSVVTVLFAIFSVVTVGSSVLVARMIGAGDSLGAADAIEQSIRLGVLMSIACTLLCEILARPLLIVFMPSAEETMIGEAARYFRVLMISMPTYVLHGVLSAISRAAGNSKSPMRVAICMNVLQILFGFLLIKVFHWEEIDAGLAYVLCRLFGAGMMLWAMLNEKQHYKLSLKRMFKPNHATEKRIMSIGLPCTMESIFVQTGYLLANSMSIKLGAFEAGVYQILNTVNTFISLPQGIGSTVALTAVGHLLGAKLVQDARRAGRVIWGAGIAATLILGFLAWALGTPLCGLYSSDPETIRQSASLLWILIIMDIAGETCNAIDPQLRAGGDVRFVMLDATTGVWLVRLPLTCLFCFVLDFGVLGLFLANTAALYYRAGLSLIRLRGNKWYAKKV